MQSTIAIIFLLERENVAQGEGSEKERMETVKGAKHGWRKENTACKLKASHFPQFTNQPVNCTMSKLIIPLPLWHIASLNVPKQRARKDQQINRSFPEGLAST